jgi:hypothetical protein
MYLCWGKVPVVLFLVWNVVLISNVSVIPTLRATKSILETLELSPNYMITWMIEEGSDRIEFELSAETKGYVGFGLSPTGGMNGSDMIIAGVYKNGTGYFSVRNLFFYLHLVFLKRCFILCFIVLPCFHLAIKI